MDQPPECTVNFVFVDWSGGCASEPTHVAQAEREAAGKAAAAAEEESARLKKKLQEAAEELEEAMRRHLADQQRVQVKNAAI